MKTFIFDIIIKDHVGNIRGARKKALKYANEHKATVIIRESPSNDIVDMIYPDDAVVKGRFIGNKSR